MYLIKVLPYTVVDGPGLRCSVYFSGCEHHCKGCHNPETWDYSYGKNVHPNKIFEQIQDSGLKNVTLSGGDPFAQPLSELLVLLKLLEGYNIWCYTGYTWEEIKDSHKELLKYIDVLVDGRFNQELKSDDCLYRGSTNQRLIDCKKSLETGKVELWTST